MGIVIFGTAAALCLGYFIGIVIYTKAVGFGMFWLLAALAAFLVCAILTMRKKYPDFLKLSLWAKSALAACTAAALVVFAVSEILVASGMGQRAPEQELDYLIVLGTKAEGREPSDTLRRRLDVAVSYLKEHENTRVILSGGKGADETWTESQVMYRYLKNAGIKTHRMVMETRSRDTEENIVYSLNLLQKNDSVGIVTSEFHMYRAVALARKRGWEEVYGLSASSNPFLLPNQMVREGFAIVWEKCMGNI